MSLASRIAVLALLLCPLALALDLRNAIILSSPNKAAQMLTEEIAKRTQIRLPIMSFPLPNRPSIVLGSTANGPTPPDSYRISQQGNSIVVAGATPRAVLFGAGYLLRHLHMERQILEAPDNLQVSEAPRYSLRGHQLGYRPKVNTYDGWTPAQFEQYIRDLAIFGTNAIELIPPRSDDDEDSPHFTLPKIDMMEEVSRICDQYGLDVWIWFPAMDKDYSDPAAVQFALKEWDEVYRRLPRIDAIFVPGGDPGHTRPKHLMALLEQQTALLHKTHPRAEMWMSPQSFSAEWMDEWFALMNQNPAWLSGIVYGPQVRIPVQELRAKIPAKYPLRLYPDITHSRQSQYPVPDWDLAFASTEGREVINPRPTQQAKIFHANEKLANGFLTYSEGVNDDVNKFVWSGLGWNPDTPVIEILREFSRYFISYPLADSFAQGLLALEQNWVGPLATNTGVNITLQQFQAMEHTASPQVLENWRFQQALYRAYYDYYLRARLVTETAAETTALDQLRAGNLDEAAHILKHSEANPPAQWARARVFEIAEALFQSIRMQLSVAKYKAEATERGANLDMIDTPLNNRNFLLKQIATGSRQAIDEILNWASPGPGGFYDKLGDPSNSPHLIHESSRTGFALRDLSYPRSWWSQAETLYDDPLRMRYTNLDPAAQYKIKVLYGGDSPKPKIRLLANETIEIHPLLQRPVPFHPLEFDIPKTATATGELNLKWNREPGLGDSGRGLQLSEVWLIKK